MVHLGKVTVEQVETMKKVTAARPLQNIRNHLIKVSSIVIPGLLNAGPLNLIPVRLYVVSWARKVMLLAY